MEIVGNYEIKKKVNIKALSMYFRYDYINPPETIFENIFKLSHGQYLKYEKGKIVVKTYWDIIDKFNNNSNNTITDFNIAKNMIKDNLNDFIKEAVKTEKNIGTYLSSGINSSLVTALCVKNSNKKIHTFSIGFYDEKQNEAEKSKKIANYLGTIHHELYLNKDDIIKKIKKIPEYYKEPFADSSGVPSVVLNEFAKDNNIEIAITGDGADQLFCGGIIYDKILSCQKAYRLLNPLKLDLKNKIINNTKMIMIYANNNKDYQAQSNILWNERLFDYIPKEYYDNKKRGFGINKRKWIKEYLYEDLIRLSTKSFIEKQNIFNYDKVCQLIKEIDNYQYTCIIWNYCIFQIWYEKYII